MDVTEGGLTEPVWRATNRPAGRGCGGCNRLTNHALRGEYTLCGIPVEDEQWHPPTAPARCRECAEVPAGHATHWDLTGMGPTYRQLDYWTRKGLVVATGPAPGSGHRRYWPAEEAGVAAVMARLVAAGVSVEGAHRAARNDGWLSGDVRVLVSSPAVTARPEAVAA